MQKVGDKINDYDKIKTELRQAIVLCNHNVSCRHGSAGPPIPVQKVNIGKREIVGFGVNGEANYIDSVMSPFPAIRYQQWFIYM